MSRGTFDQRVLSALPAKKSSTALATFDNEFLFCVGGSEPGDTQQEYKYSFKSDVWDTLPAMGAPRQNLSCCVLGSFLYGFGLGRFTPDWSDSTSNGVGKHAGRLLASDGSRWGAHKTAHAPVAML